MRTKLILIATFVLLFCSTTVGTAAMNSAKEQLPRNEPCLALFLHVDHITK